MGRSAYSLGTAQRGDALEELLKRFLQLLRAGRIRVLQLAPELTFPQAPQELFAGRVVDSLCLGARVELGQQSDCFVVERCAFGDVRAKCAMRRVVEVLGRELGEQRAQSLVRKRTCQCVPFELRARIEHAL